jgi:hypothetical protein
MQNAQWYFNRLRSMDAAEIRWRIASALRDQLDLLRIPLARYPRLPEGSVTTAAAFEPGFRCTPVQQSDWAGLERDLAGHWLSRLRDKADLICDNRLSYFDLSRQHHGDPFNWHRDFSAGIDSPVVHVTKTDYRLFSRFGDCKLVWEPNRHHQLVVLARAYRATGERRYAEKVAELMLSWIAANPFGYGMNWKSPLELGIRLINWVWALDLTRDAGVFTDDAWRSIQQTCWLAMWDIERKLSQGSSANNHLLGEAAGLYVAACYFAHFPDASRWRRRCRDVLERELLAQSYPDGCTREHAFGYQFFVLQFMVIASLAGAGRGEHFAPRFLERVHAMYRFLHEICLDTGSPPALGDQDDGYVLDLGELPAQPGPLIAVGGMMFDDARLLDRRPAETGFWLFGQDGLKRNDAPASRRSVRFADAGYFILRGGEEAGDRRLSVFFDCAELGYGPIAAHGHADALSFTLNVGDRPVLVDAGTYDYFTHPWWRDYFRSTRAHNTVEVDAVSQSESLGPFLWGKKAIARCLDWLDTERLTVVCGEHDGYRRLPSPLLHRRKLELDKASQTLALVDTLEGSGTHTARWHFHLDPGCRAKRLEPHTIRIEAHGRRLQLSSTLLEFSIVPAGDRVRTGWISKSYHRKEASACIVSELTFSGSRTAPMEIAVLG